jgi:hypothetical protein
MDPPCSERPRYLTDSRFRSDRASWGPPGEPAPQTRAVRGDPRIPGHVAHCARAPNPALLGRRAPVSCRALRRGRLASLHQQAQGGRGTPQALRRYLWQFEGNGADPQGTTATPGSGRVGRGKPGSHLRPASHPNTRLLHPKARRDPSDAEVHRLLAETRGSDKALPAKVSGLHRFHNYSARRARRDLAPIEQRSSRPTDHRKQ